MELIQSEKLAHFIVHILNADPNENQNIERFLSRMGISYHYSNQATELLAGLSSTNAGCVLLDVRLPFYSVSELLQLLKKHDPCLPIIFMGQDKDIQSAIKVLKAGAFDFLLKPLDEQHLLDVINKALRQRQEQLQTQTFLEKVEKHLQLLSTRENEVLHQLLKGLSNKKIGLALAISAKTVEQHRANIMRKMQVESLAELVSRVVCYQIKTNKMVHQCF